MNVKRRIEQGDVAVNDQQRDIAFDIETDKKN